jgi:hypothetical protein
MLASLLDINEPTTHHYAEIVLELKRIGRPIPTNDLWIAALSRQHSLPLLNRDRHFDIVAGAERNGSAGDIGIPPEQYNRPLQDLVFVIADIYLLQRGTIPAASNGG